MYEYKAIVTKIYDADTITVDIDLGFGIWVKKQSIRLARIQAPEIRGEERPRGLISRDILREWLPLGSEVIIKTNKDAAGKYGRWLGEIYSYEEFIDIEDLGSIVSYNQRLLNEGYADLY